MKKDNYKEVKKVLWTILFVNIAVAFTKIVIGLLIKSASLMADGFHCVSDGASNVVGLIGTTIASKPKDREHPYGHSKFEVITSMFIGGMLVFIGINIILEAIDRFYSPVVAQIEIQSLVVLFITMIINIVISKYESKKGKELGSHILISDSKHTRSDIFVSVGVILTLIGIKLGLPVVIDTIMSVIVAGFILHASYKIFKESIDILVDKKAVDEERIKEIVEQYNEVRGVHNIRSRGSIYDMHIDMHILVNPYVTTDKAHELAHEIEDDINEKLGYNIQVTIHIEPYYE